MAALRDFTWQGKNCSLEEATKKSFPIIAKVVSLPNKIDLKREGILMNKVIVLGDSLVQKRVLLKNSSGSCITIPEHIAKSFCLSYACGDVGPSTTLQSLLKSKTEAEVTISDNIEMEFSTSQDCTNTVKYGSVKILGLYDQQFVTVSALSTDHKVEQFCDIPLNLPLRLDIAESFAKTTGNFQTLLTNLENSFSSQENYVNSQILHSPDIHLLESVPNFIRDAPNRKVAAFLYAMKSGVKSPRSSSVEVDIKQSNIKEPTTSDINVNSLEKFQSLREKFSIGNTKTDLKQQSNTAPKNKFVKQQSTPNSLTAALAEKTLVQQKSSLSIPTNIETKTVTASKEKGTSASEYQSSYLTPSLLRPQSTGENVETKSISQIKSMLEKNNKRMSLPGAIKQPVPPKANNSKWNTNVNKSVKHDEPQNSIPVMYDTSVRQQENDDEDFEAMYDPLNYTDSTVSSPPVLPPLRPETVQYDDSDDENYDDVADIKRPTSSFSATTTTKPKRGNFVSTAGGTMQGHMKTFMRKINSMNISTTSSSDEWKRASDIPLNVKDFTISQIGNCLSCIKLGRYRKRFADQMIDGKILMTFSENACKELGMKEFEAKKLMQFVYNDWRPDSV